MFAAAIENGTLPQYGDVGNAVNFQSGQTAYRNGLAPNGANIGGNWFSDRFGSPTSNFQAPSYGASTDTTAGGLYPSSNTAADTSQDLSQDQPASTDLSSGSGMTDPNAIAAQAGQGLPGPLKSLGI